MLDFKDRINQLNSMLNPCLVCPNKCGINRTVSNKGKCRTGLYAAVSSYNLHFGEEPPVSGISGSGTIFFANCVMSCVFCQNYPISQFGHGNIVSADKLSDIMLELMEKGAHNINFVTPTHVVPQIVEALSLAREKGMNLPIVYNSSGYESVETLKLLDGIINVYMPDAKYSASEMSRKYSGPADYWEVNKAALKEMFRQVGNLVTDEKGIAQKGIIIRHLVLPENISGTKTVLEFIADEISKDVFISLMAQYHPAHNSYSYPELSRKITRAEYDKAVEILNNLGFSNGWIQEI